MIDKLFLTSVMLTFSSIITTFLTLIISNNVESDLADWMFMLSLTCLMVLPFVSMILLIVKIWS